MYTSSYYRSLHQICDQQYQIVDNFPFNIRTEQELKEKIKFYSVSRHNLSTFSSQIFDTTGPEIQKETCKDHKFQNT